MSSPLYESPLTLVLDTNVVIDWLVFDDAFMAPLRDGIAQRQIRVLTHAPAIVELQRVVGYPALKLSPPTGNDRLSPVIWLRRTVPTLPQGFSTTQMLTPAGFPRCRDPDDQHFLAFAFHTRAQALVSERQGRTETAATRTQVRCEHSDRAGNDRRVACRPRQAASRRRLSRTTKTAESALPS